jgi:hypothetical protein
VERFQRVVTLFHDVETLARNTVSNQGLSFVTHRRPVKTICDNFEDKPLSGSVTKVMGSLKKDVTFSHRGFLFVL